MQGVPQGADFEAMWRGLPDRLRRYVQPQHVPVPMSDAQWASTRQLTQQAEPQAGSDPCAICMEGFRARERLLRLPCGHLFHSACVRPWLERTNTCPLCRAVVQ